QPYAEKAMRLSDTTSERERYFIKASYHELLGQREKAIAAYEALLDLYPDHPWAAGNLLDLYDCFHNPDDLEKAVQWEALHADSRPNDFSANWIAAFDLVALKRQPARADIYLRRARELVTRELRDRFQAKVGWLELLPFTEDWVRGDLGAAAAEIDGLTAKFDSLAGFTRDSSLAQVALGDLTLGRIAAAAQISARIVDAVV